MTETFRFRKILRNDYEPLLQFTSRAELKGPIDLQVQRRANPFEFHRMQSEDIECYVLENETGEIQASFSLVYCAAFIRRVEHTVCFITDFRLSPTKSAVRGFAAQFLDILTHANDARGVKYAFAVLSHTQEEAFQPFLRPRRIRKNMARFYLVRRFDAVSVHGKYPQFSEDQISLRIQHATLNDFELLAHYLQKKMEPRLLGVPTTEISLRSQIQSWAHSKIQDFIIARDFEGQIVGCVLPYRMDHVQQLKVLRFNGFAQTLKTAFYWLSFLKLVQRLPSAGDHLKLQYLTHFHADNPDIFQMLLKTAYHERRQGEIPVYAHFNDDPLTLPAYPMISTRFPFALYTVIRPDEAPPNYLRTSPMEPPPNIEPIFI